MKNNLNLITTETFGNLPCNFYQDTNKEILLTREQIGTALEYSSPQKAIQKIHYRHKNRLDELCIRIVENRMPQNGGIGVNVETVYYTQKGIMEICRWSNKPKASQFMDWVWDIVEKYRANELIPSQQIDMKPLIDAITTLTNNMITTQQPKLCYQKQENTVSTEKD